MPSTVGIVASGEDVLNDAVFWVDAGLSSVVSGALTNLGTGGPALNAQFGSTSGTDSFDPQLLTHTGTNYLYLPGSANNYASTPHSTALNIAGGIELIGRAFGLPSADGYLALKGSAYSTRAYSAVLRSTGALGFWSRDSASATKDVNSSAVLPYGSSTPFWWRITADPAAGAVNFYHAADQSTQPSSWTQLGTTQTASWSGSAFATNTDSLLIGNALAAGVFAIKVRDGIGGTAVFDANFTTGITSGAQTTFTESSANAATVTINRATSGRKSVAVVRNVLSFGTDDYLEVADSDLLDFGASDSFTVMAVVRQWATPTSFGRIIDKMSGAPSTGWTMLNNSTGLNRYLSIADGTVTVNAGTTNAYTAGVLTVTSAVRNVVTDNITLRNGNTGPSASSDTTTASLANANVMRIGSAATGGAYQDMELVAAAVWRRALNTNEIATLTARYT